MAIGAPSGQVASTWSGTFGEQTIDVSAGETIFVQGMAFALPAIPVLSCTDQTHGDTVEQLFTVSRTGEWRITVWKIEVATGGLKTIRVSSDLASDGVIHAHKNSASGGFTLDQARSGFGTGTSGLKSSGLVTTTVADEYLIGGLINSFNKGPVTPGAPWNELTDLAGGEPEGQVQYRIVAATGDYDSTGTFAASHAGTRWEAWIVTLSEAGGGGGATLQPATVASAAQVFAPLVQAGTPPPVTLQPTLVAGAAAVHAPSVGQGAAVAPAAVASAAVVQAPGIGRGIAASATPSPATVHQPSLSEGVQSAVQPGAVASAAAVHAPAVQATPATITASHIASASVVQAPTLTAGSAPVTLQPGAVASGAQVHAPVVQATSVTVTTSHVASVAAAFEPGIQAGIPPGAIGPLLVTSAGAVHSPTLQPGAVLLAPTTIGSGATVHAPGLGHGVRPATIGSAAIVFAAAAVPGANTLLPGAIAAVSVVFAPAVLQPGAAKIEVVRLELVMTTRARRDLRMTDYVSRELAMTTKVRREVIV